MFGPFSPAGFGCRESIAGRLFRTHHARGAQVPDSIASCMEAADPRSGPTIGSPVEAFPGGPRREVTAAPITPRSGVLSNSTALFEQITILISGRSLGTAAAALTFYATERADQPLVNIPTARVSTRTRALQGRRECLWVE